MNRVLIICSILFFISIQATAQRTYTLQECIDSALAKNIPVKRAELGSEASRVALNQSRMNLLPDLNANVNHSHNTGRSIDPFTNAYVNQRVNAANYSVGSGVILFNGLSLQNSIRQNATAYEASRFEYQQAKNNLIIDVIAAYLQVLSSEDQVRLTISQMENSQAAYDRLMILDKQGAVRPSDVTDLKGELMTGQLNLLDARAALETSKVALAVLMNQPYDSAMKVERVNPAEFLSPYGATVDEVFQNSLDHFALVKAVELRTRSAEYSVKAIRGQLFPTVSLNVGMNTNYSSVAQNGGQKIPYTNQLKNNRFSSIGIGLNIPIFNNSFVRNRVKLADINRRDMELVEENTKLQLRQLIDLAYLDMSNAYNRYKVLLEQVRAYEESFKAAEIRFLAGVGTSIDYLIAKNRLDLSNIGLVNAQYMYLLRKRILDYYNGK